MLLAAAVIASVGIGLRARHGGRSAFSGRSAIFVNLALGILAIPAGIHVVSVATASAPPDAQFAPAPSFPPGLAYDGTPLRDIYYTRATADCSTTCCCSATTAGRSTSIRAMSTRRAGS